MLKDCRLKVYSRYSSVLSNSLSGAPKLPVLALLQLHLHFTWSLAPDLKDLVNDSASLCFKRFASRFEKDQPHLGHPCSTPPDPGSEKTWCSWVQLSTATLDHFVSSLRSLRWFGDFGSVHGLPGLPCCLWCNPGFSAAVPAKATSIREPRTNMFATKRLSAKWEYTWSWSYLSYHVHTKQYITFLYISVDHQACSARFA